MSPLDELVATIEAMSQGRRVAVAVDGPDAAGKTTYAHQLASRIRRHVIAASVDGWHHPRAVRIRRGELSPQGYYSDSFDRPALIARLLGPFTSGSPSIETAGFDHRSDSELPGCVVPVPPEAVLVLDGVFLLRPELRRLWDLGVYLHVPERVTLARALRRDVGLLGTPEEVRARYETKYLPGQALYRALARPLEAAHVVLDNTEPATPVVLKWDVPGDQRTRL